MDRLTDKWTAGKDYLGRKFDSTKDFLTPADDTIAAAKVAARDVGTFGISAKLDKRRAAFSIPPIPDDASLEDARKYQKMVKDQNLAAKRINAREAREGKPYVASLVVIIIVVIAVLTGVLYFVLVAISYFRIKAYRAETGDESVSLSNAWKLKGVFRPIVPKVVVAQDPYTGEAIIYDTEEEAPIQA